jgi:hypothetical protein
MCTKGVVFDKQGRLMVVENCLQLCCPGMFGMGKM